MKILAINNGHNATAGVFEDGKCLCIYHEEKFTNKKNHSGIPHKSLEYLSRKYDFSELDVCVFSSIDQIMVTEDSAGFVENVGASFIRKYYNWFEYNVRAEFITDLVRKLLVRGHITPRAQKILTDIMVEEYGIKRDKIIYSDHHTNHCLTPLFFFGLEKLKENILLVSMDGAGDNLCSRVIKYNHKNNRLTQISQTDYVASPALMYREMTRFLGMKPLEHEHKVMGLAAYVSDEKYYKDIYNELRKVIWIDKNSLTFKSTFNIAYSSLLLRDKFVSKRFDNLGAAVQKFIEDLMLEWIRVLVKKTKVSTLALSGGIFMNVKLNQKIVNLKEVEKAYFQPSCGDDSLIIGAAAQEFRKKKIKLKPIKTMLLGHTYSNKEVEEYLKEKKVFDKYEVEYYDDIEKQSAMLLAEHEIIPRFKGPGEWGARSLCNRAILGNASDLRTFYRVNDQVKMRDFWMPFAPTMLAEWGPKYIKNWNMYKRKAYDSTKYMILTFDTTPLAREHLRAAIHQKDLTMRPQLVDKSDSKEMYKLLKYYEELTGMGGVLNTSLNIHGYPLVGTLDQALFTYENSGLKYLSLENFLIKKKS